MCVWSSWLLSWKQWHLLCLKINLSVCVWKTSVFISNEDVCVCVAPPPIFICEQQIYSSLFEIHVCVFTANEAVIVCLTLWVCVFGTPCVFIQNETVCVSNFVYVCVCVDVCVHRKRNCLCVYKPRECVCVEPPFVFISTNWSCLCVAGNTVYVCARADTCMSAAIAIFACTFQICSRSCPALLTF